MFWLNFYQIAYIDKIIDFPYISTSFPRSARAESNSESGIFTNILHSNWKYIRCKTVLHHLYNSRLNNYLG